MFLNPYYYHQHNESKETITTQNERSRQVSNQPGIREPPPPDFENSSEYSRSARF